MSPVSWDAAKVWNTCGRNSCSAITWLGYLQHLPDLLTHTETVRGSPLSFSQPIGIEDQVPEFDFEVESHESESWTEHFLLYSRRSRSCRRSAVGSVVACSIATGGEGGSAVGVATILTPVSGNVVVAIVGVVSGSVDADLDPGEEAI
jgi:hypothetical protein